MKKLFSVFISLIIVALIVISGRLFIESQKELNIQRTTRESGMLELTEKSIEDKETYYSEVEKLNTQTFMDEPVNTYIDSVFMDFVDENVATKAAKHKRAVLTNTIDSYNVNDNIYGIRVTINLKRVDSEDYTTIIKTFNYNKELGREVSLSGIFRVGYEDIVGDYDQLLLKSQSMYLYTGNTYREVPYNSLKDFAIKNVLLAYNLKIPQEEYNEMFATQIDPNAKMVAITFDDGPHKTNTNEILKIMLYIFSPILDLSSNSSASSSFWNISIVSSL